jgi:hypothetical protein
MIKANVGIFINRSFALPADETGEEAGDIDPHQVTQALVKNRKMLPSKIQTDAFS